MKNYQKGFSIAGLFMAIAVFLGFAHTANNIATTTTERTGTTTTHSIATSDNATPLNGWVTYSNTKYDYSISYPRTWYINTQWSNSDFTPRGPAPSNYIGGDTSISNYSQSYLDEYQKKNGEMAVPSDILRVNLMFWKIPATTSLNDALNSIGVAQSSDEESNRQSVTIAGITGIKTTDQRGIGGNTKANNVGIWLKTGDELINIGYGFDGNNSGLTDIANKIIASFKLNK
ncbi:MAG: hypothetical protein KGI49_01945 [Patescibacteria group bacterium]|nr:hypothetical protein [Patescibacteria group bacterium]